MNAVPARVAGVPQIVMVVPTPRGKVNPAVLAAAHLAGVTEVYRIGEARAVGSLAYGTATIRTDIEKKVGATPMWQRPSAGFSASLASTRLPGHPK